jgi:hypothetical protein
MELLQYGRGATFQPLAGAPFSNGFVLFTETASPLGPGWAELEGVWQCFSKTCPALPVGPSYMPNLTLSAVQQASGGVEAFFLDLSTKPPQIVSYSWGGAGNYVNTTTPGQPAQGLWEDPTAIRGAQNVYVFALQFGSGMAYTITQ